MSYEADLFSQSDEAGESSEVQEVLTAAEVLQRLETAWLNEKFSPEILMNRSEVVDCLLEQTKAMEDSIEHARKGDFRAMVHRMEIERIRYMICDYLRLRLKKIEDNVFYILNSSEVEKLTPEELVFARDYYKGLKDHLTNVALRHMPPGNLQVLNEKEAGGEPNLHAYVFTRINRTVKGVMVEKETNDIGAEVIDLVEGDQHIIRYQPLRGLIEDGSVSLI